MHNRLLALDQSSRTTGWAVFEGSKLLDSGTFTISGGDIGIRMVKIKLKILQLLDKYKINEVIFEDIQLQGESIKNIQTFKILAEVFGVLWETFEELNMKNSAVLSSVWKSSLGIKGEERSVQKKNAQIFVSKTYGKKVSEDESDAICIGTYKVRQTEVFDWSD